MRVRRISIITMLILVLCALEAFAGTFTEVPSSQLTVIHDDGNGSVYQSLPENYAKLNRLDLNNAVIISGSGYTIADAQSGSADKATRPHLIWTGKMKYGGSIRTSTSDAVLVNNTLPDVTLKFPEGAALSDGKTADVIVKLDKISVKLTKSFNSKITSSTNVKVLVAASGTAGLSLVTSSPKTAVDKWDYTDADKSSSAGAAYRLRTSIKLTEPASGNTIGETISTEDYPSMLVQFKDLDVRDYTLKSNSTYTQLWNGSYSESIEMTTGWGNPIALAPMGEGILNQSLVEKQVVNGNTRIKGKGSQFEELERVTGSAGDTHSFYSGFAAPVSPEGFSFYWTGSIKGGSGSSSNMGTVIGGQPTVSVKAMRSEGGSLGNTETGVRSELNDWYNNTHLMNSAATYNYCPEEGWVVSYLKVDGELQELSDDQRLHGGSYVFERLNKNPVSERVLSEGNILDAEDSSYYTIEVKYVRQPEYVTEKTSDIESIEYGSDQEIKYTIKCTEKHEEAAAGSHQITDDLAGGLLSIVPGSLEVSLYGGSSHTVDQMDEEALKVTFTSPEVYEGDTQPMIIISYRATVNWEKYTGGKIVNTADGDTCELDVTCNLNVSKVVKGNLGDLSKKFRFSASLSGLKPSSEYSIVSNGADFPASSSIRNTQDTCMLVSDEEGKAEFDFLLRDDESLSIESLDSGAVFVITEEASDHNPSYTVTKNGEVVKQDAKESSQQISTGEITADSGNVDVVFTNERNLKPVTGTAPGIAGLCAASLGAVMIIIVTLIKLRKIRD